MDKANERYLEQKQLYGVINQVFEDYKYGLVSSGHTWNLPTQEVRGITLRFRGEGLLELVYHRYEMATSEGMQRIMQSDEGMKFVKNVAKQLRKEFKETTGKELKLKVHKELPVIPEKASRLTAENSWMIGSSRHDYRPVGRYLIRSVCLYEFSSSL